MSSDALCLLSFDSIRYLADLSRSLRNLLFLRIKQRFLLLLKQFNLHWVHVVTQLHWVKKKLDPKVSERSWRLYNSLSSPRSSSSTVLLCSLRWPRQPFVVIRLLSKARARVGTNVNAANGKSNNSLLCVWAITRRRVGLLSHIMPRRTAVSLSVEISAWRESIGSFAALAGHSVTVNAILPPAGAPSDDVMMTYRWRTVWLRGGLHDVNIRCPRRAVFTDTVTIVW